MTEKSQHDLLFTITAILFILFSTGLAVPGEINTGDTIVIP
ncbi:MAG: hypothetical protein N2484_15810 [Clostridia bacterium]|nr:hypothetical protein [Clostridia bacterium]